MKLYTKEIINKLADSSSSVDELLNKLDFESTYELEPLDVEAGQAVIFMFPIEYGEAVAELAPLLQKVYPDNPVVAIVDDIDILISNADDALSLLDNIKAKISILKDTNDAGKIVV